MWRFLTLAVFCLAPLAAIAQDAASERDRGYLTALIEDSLSGAGRSVQLDGFAGALSSRATFDQLSIADDSGVWITIRNGAIKWNRTALLSGRIEIDEMTAEEIDFPRRPATSATPSEATGFSLPVLPVAVSIGTLRADRVYLGQPILGVAADVRLTASAILKGGEGSASLAIDRIDGQQGSLTLTAAYSNTTRDATLDLLVQEAAGGITVELFGIPGRPSAELAIHGNGVIDDFRADVSIRTDGQPRVSGRIQFRAETGRDGAVTRGFQARLAGDVTPLFLPEYRDFFGEDISLEAEGRRLPTGRIDLSRLVIDSKGVDLTGQLSLGANGVPLQAAVTLRLGLASGGEVLLPIPGEQTFVQAADLQLHYDRARESGWTLAGAMSGLRRPSLSLARIEIAGSGRIEPGGGPAPGGLIGGTFRFDAQGIAPADPGLRQAIGADARGKTVFTWAPGGRLRLSALELRGPGYRAAGTLAFGGLETGLDVTGRLSANVADLARFEGLSGRPVGGAGDVSVRGSYGILSGIVDGDLMIRGRNLSVSQAEIDSLLSGDSELSASLRRDETGTRIRSFTLSARTLKATAAGLISSRSSDLAADLDFSDLSALGGRYRGALKASATMTGPADARVIALTATGDRLAAGQAEIDRIIGSPSELSLAMVQKGSAIELNAFRLANREVAVEATGTPSEAGQAIALSARLRDMALLAPGFPGPLTLSGTVDQREAGYRVDLQGAGPGGTAATITGSVATDGSTTDLAIRGSAQSAMINAFIAPRNISGPITFDLGLNGRPGLDALSGRVSLQDAAFIAPIFGIAIENLGAAADLTGGRATIAASGQVRGGGEVRLSGPVVLTRPYTVDLTTMLRAVHLRDPELYDTNVDGEVRVVGPLLGGADIRGAVRLGKTEVRIPSSGFGNPALLEDITHIAEPRDALTTRMRAGLVTRSGAAREKGSPYGLDLTISAPERIFVRGRGLDAELGGALTLTGTTENVIPSGQFNLIRGRLDILGKRLTIDEGLIQLQGALTPYIRFGATTQSGGITATIVIEGDATTPEITFSSNPDLPEEEVIARILFAKDLKNLSAFQAAQLASALANLAGKGSGGIIAKLRDSFALDDLDIATDAAGQSSLRVGKYISEKVYSNVVIGSDGKSEVNLNLDVRPDLTLRGTLTDDGKSSVGIYYERDY